ncbi:tyrosine-type recombinase/integrase [Mesorhizobium carmichaelinearum]|uniref:tyrosine-type recombinase/integrase n=1 Tax=Mesorhizobium carmichaelinearum TaxID=1208188 RepID=UPI001FCED952|nr:tyrosine-type recombinase/integrase [Mesorhizobium carmichaelinearum]
MTTVWTSGLHEPSPFKAHRAYQFFTPAWSSRWGSLQFPGLWGQFCTPIHSPGSHTLRHACVQRLVDTGFSLKTIGDYVGHRAASSTMIYAKVQIDGLREVALGDGEDLQ